MNSTDVKARLAAAQLALCDALDAETPEQMPAIIASREADLRALVEMFDDEPHLKAWAAEYLERDRELLARAAVARDQVEQKMQHVARQRSVHRIYISEGLRR